MRRKWKLGTFLGPVLLVGAAIAYGATIPQASMTFTTIDFPANGVLMTHVFGINSLGDVVGSYVDSAGVEHGYLLSGGIGGNFTQIDYPKALATRATGINRYGNIVGYYIAPPGASGESMKGFLATPSLQGYKFTTILFPHHPAAYLSSIADDGSIYGCYHDGDAEASMHGFVRDADGHSTSLDVKDSMDNGGIPDNSTIVGNYTDLGTNKEHGFVDSDGSFANLDVFGSVWTEARGVSLDWGTVGSFLTADGRVHGFLFSNGAFSSIDDPDATGVTQVFAINGSGVIVGFYRGKDGKHHGFLAQPN